MIKSHEAIVHFPIALFIAAFMLGIVGVFYRRDLFKEIIFWNIIIGIVASAAAIYTGLEEQEKISDQHLQEVLDMHKRNAYFSGILLVVLTAWMGIRKKTMERLEYVAWMSLFFVASTAVGYQGYMGHEMTAKQTEKTIEVKISAAKLRQEPKPVDYGFSF